MSRDADIPTLDRNGLKRFAITVGGALAAVFGLAFPWLLERSIPLWPWVVAGVLVAWGLAAPLTLGPVYRAWMRFGLVLHRITTPLVLGVSFYAVILPAGWIGRVLGRDTMARGFDDGAESYRVASRVRSREHMEKPF